MAGEAILPGISRRKLNTKFFFNLSRQPQHCDELMFILIKLKLGLTFFESSGPGGVCLPTETLTARPIYCI